MVSNWEGLHEDIFDLILRKIKLIENFITIGMVCKSWNEAARNNIQSLRPQIPWLMLAENEITKDGHRHIYSLSNHKISTNTLRFPSDRRCIGLNYGWVLTVSRLSGDLNLLHPISGCEIKLPNQYTIKEELGMWPSYLFIHKAAISGNPSESGSNFMVMILHGCGEYMGYWRPGETCWTSNLNTKCGFYDVIYYNDQFYAISCTGILWACIIDHDKRNIALRQVSVIDRDQIFGEDIFVYIVESSSPDVLLLLVRTGILEDPDDGIDMFQTEAAAIDEEGEKLYEDIYVRYGVINFKVYELNLVNGNCSKNVRHLGDRAVFVGHSTSMSFDASQFVGINPNHIYFTDSCDEWYIYSIKGGGNDMGCYCLEDGEITRFNVGESRSRICPPFWFIPSL